MKRFLSIFTLLTLFIYQLPFALTALAEPGNLINNSSAESSSDANNPDNWAFNSWGDINATKSYSDDAYDGAKSLNVQVTSRTSGDAKWMHDAVDIIGGEKYTFTSYYKSTTDTEIDLQLQNNDGSYSYKYVQYVPVSDTWKPISFSLEAPADASKVVVMHIIAGVGSLNIDDFNLQESVDVPPPTDDNLLLNPSLEISEGLNPAAWNNNSWGSNSATFNYENTGHTGDKSVKVSISNYSSGDAKWYADPVAIDGGESYTYSEFYTSNVDTRVVAALIDESGSYSYKELPFVIASAQWREYSTLVEIPLNTQKIAIYHVIDKVGYLSIDDANLAKYTTTLPTDIVPNNSVEISNGSTSPMSWNNNSWGSNSATFNYENTGHTGDKSVKVSISNYSSGDAKWYFEPINTLDKLQQYKFDVYYKTNINPKVVGWFKDGAGVSHYIGLKSPLPSADVNQWQHYSDTFEVPSDAEFASVFMLISENGWLQTDDYSLTKYNSEGFDRPLLSLTFDDGHEDNVYTALPLLNSYNIKSTQCYATTYIENDAEAVNNVLEFYNTGHEVCSHSVTHPFLTTLNAADLRWELSQSQGYLEQIINDDVLNFASPYGDYNYTVIDEIKNYYQTHRSVDAGYNNHDNYDEYALKVQNVLSTTSVGDIQHWISQAQAENSWLILVYHRVADNPGTYDTYTSDFIEQLQAIDESGITIKTFNEAYLETKQQL